MAFKPSAPITQVNGFPVKVGWYGTFTCGSAEQSRESLQVSWTTPAQDKHNAAHETCGRCRGRGYTRRDGRFGCSQCGGTGSLPK